MAKKYASMDDIGGKVVTKPDAKYDAAMKARLKATQESAARVASRTPKPVVKPLTNDEKLAASRKDQLQMRKKVLGSL